MLTTINPEELDDLDFFELNWLLGVATVAVEVTTAWEKAGCASCRQCEACEDFFDFDWDTLDSLLSIDDSGTDLSDYEALLAEIKLRHARAESDYFAD